MSGISRFIKSRHYTKAANRLINAIILFYFCAFLLIAFKPAQSIDTNGLIMAGAISVMLAFVLHILPKLFPVDRLSLAIVSFLCSLGVLILYSTNKERGIQQGIFFGIGIIFMLMCMIGVRYMIHYEIWSWLIFPVSLALMISPLLFGQEANGATNWIYINGVSIQPSEFVKLALIFTLANAMGRRKLISWLVFLASCLVLLMLQQDLGAALLYFVTASFMYFASGGSIPFLMLGGVVGTGAAIYGYSYFAHVKKRVAIWLNPWSDSQGDGYQLVQSLMAIASGGLLGMGLGLGNPSVIPIYYTDFIFSVICEQFGLIFGALVLVLYILLILRGVFIAKTAQTRFHSLLALGCTCMIGLQTFVIIGGVIKLIPLTGVTLPFVSYGGSSLVSCMGIVGILQGVAGFNSDSLEDDAILTEQERSSGNIF